MLSFLQRKKELIITHEDIVSHIEVDFSRLDKIGEDIRTEQEVLKEEINNHKKEKEQEQTEKKILDEKINKLIELNTTVVVQERELKNSKEKLKEKEEQYRVFLQNFKGIAFHVKLDGTPIFIHGLVEEITGYTTDEFFNGNLRWRKIVHKDDIDDLYKDNDKMRSIPGFIKEKEYRLVCKDGSIKWVHEVLQTIADPSGTPESLYGTLWDITEEKKIQRKLREQYELLNTVMENVDIMMWTKSDDGRYMTATNDFVKNFAKLDNKEEIIGITDLDIINIYRKKGGDNKFGEICMETDKFTIEKGETCRFIEMAKIDHKDVWFDVRKSPVKINSSIIGTVGTAQDVSETVPEIKSFIKSMIRKGKCEILKKDHIWWIKDKRNNH